MKLWRVKLWRTTRCRGAAAPIAMPLVLAAGIVMSGCSTGLQTRAESRDSESPIEQTVETSDSTTPSPTAAPSQGSASTQPITAPPITAPPTTTPPTTVPPTTVPPTTTPPTTTPPTTTPPIEAPSVPVEPLGDLELVFHESFDDPTLSDVWTTCFWWQVDGGCTIASNDEQQWYRPEGVSLADGNLQLTLSADPQRTTDGHVLPYRSGMVSTGQASDRTDDVGFAFTYGVVEARVRFPEGAGVWPAVWLLSADKTSLPEIDLIEWYGSRPDVATSHAHERIDGERSSERINVSSPTSLAGQWHDIAVDWTSDRIVFYFDGVETGRVDNTKLVSDGPMYLIINLAAGGPAGEVDPTIVPQTLLVDWVQIWQRPRS